MKFLKSFKVWAVTVLLIAVSGISYGVASASIPDSDDGEIHACRVTGDAGNTRIIDKQAGASCHSYETEVVWDSKLKGHEIVTNTGTVPATNPARATITATCPSGKKVMGGGWTEADEVNGPVLEKYSSYPDTSSSWSVRFWKNGGVNKDATVYAICVSG